MVLGEGYEPYHVPQQSRRDKLRVGNHHSDNNHHHQQHFLLYDHDPPSSSNFLACTDNKANSVTVAKEGLNFMGFVGRQHQYPYLDPHSSNNSFPINPSSSSIQDITSDDPFLYASHNLQNYKDFGHPYNGSNSTSSAVQGLSLSLSSHDQTHRSNYHIPLELNLQQRYNGSTAINYGDNMVPGIVGGHHVGSSASNQVVVSRRSSVPLGPFTGYASILKGSRFLKPAQQLLEEICVVGWGMYSEVKITEDDASNQINDPSIESLNDNASGLIMDAGEISQRKKSSLISMLNEVYRRYKQYYQQMQAVVESFEGVAGLGTAAPFAYLALKAMSKHFRALKNAITDQLQFTDKAYGQLSHGKEAARSGNIDRGLHCQRTVQNSGFSEHQPVWRPQRGLPERAVTVLRAWLFEHFLHPYPTDTDKLMLAKQTGLTRSQVSNWFINARVRIWKPMVEEIHKLETRQALGHSEMEEENANRSCDQVSMSNSAVSDNSLTSSRRVQDIPSKRTRNEFPDLPEEPLNLSYNSLSSNPHMGGGVSMTGRSSGVSLALGLHQNNGIGLLEPFPINAAQRFGLEPNGEAYVLDGFEAQNRHLGRDIIGLHNFVG